MYRNCWFDVSKETTTNQTGSTHVRVFEIGVILLPKLLAPLRPLLHSQPINSHSSISLLISPHQHKPPRQNQRKLNPKADGAPNRSRGVLWRILRLENLTSDHVAHAVPDEGEAGSHGALGAAGNVARDQGPGEEEAEDEGHGDEVAAPLCPLDCRIVGEEGHAEEACEGGQDGGGHDPEAKVGFFAGEEADADEDYDGHYGAGNVDEDSLEVVWRRTSVSMELGMEQVNEGGLMRGHTEAKGSHDDASKGGETAIGNGAQESVYAGEPEDGVTAAFADLLPLPPLYGGAVVAGVIGDDSRAGLG